MLIEIQLNLKIFHRSKIENIDEKLNTIPNKFIPRTVKI